MDDSKYIKVDINVIDRILSGLPSGRFNIIWGESDLNLFKKIQIRKLRELKIKRIFENEKYNL